MSVAQTDKVIIALPGEKSKMSIYEKIAIFWRSAQPFPDSADRMIGVTGCSARGSSIRSMKYSRRCSGCSLATISATTGMFRRSLKATPLAARSTLTLSCSSFYLAAMLNLLIINHLHTAHQEPHSLPGPFSQYEHLP